MRLLLLGPLLALAACATTAPADRTPAFDCKPTLFAPGPNRAGLVPADSLTKGPVPLGGGKGMADEWEVVKREWEAGGRTFRPTRDVHAVIGVLVDAGGCPAEAYVVDTDNDAYASMIAQVTARLRYTPAEHEGKAVPAYVDVVMWYDSPLDPGRFDPKRRRADGRR